MDWAEVIAQWLHIFFGTFWFGGVLFANFVVIPAVMRLPPDGQRQFIELLGKQAERIVPYMAIGAIALGFVRGTVLGDIKDIAGLGTTSGIEWLVGLVAAVATFAWGQWVLNPAASRLNAGEAATAAVMAAQIARVRGMALLELVGFFVVFTMMILMHFAGEA